MAHLNYWHVCDECCESDKEEKAEKASDYYKQNNLYEIIHLLDIIRTIKLSINQHNYFYEKISKDDWDVFDIDKKQRVFDDFLKNELVIMML